LLWARLKRGKLGVRFRRQHPIGDVILDFYCPSYRLVVEVDGGVHASDEARRRDEARDAWLARLGLRVLRLSAGLVERDVVAAVEIIRAAMR
jgi:very-short-patch-repair endonuclease